MALADRLTLWARWPAKSSVQSWFSGVEALLLQEAGPLLGAASSAGEVGVALHLGQRGEQDQHVAGFLDRHLVLLGLLAAAVDLAVGSG